MQGILDNQYKDCSITMWRDMSLHRRADTISFFNLELEYHVGGYAMCESVAISRMSSGSRVPDHGMLVFMNSSMLSW